MVVQMLHNFSLVDPRGLIASPQENVYHLINVESE